MQDAEGICHKQAGRTLLCAGQHRHKADLCCATSRLLYYAADAAMQSKACGMGSAPSERQPWQQPAPQPPPG